MGSQQEDEIDNVCAECGESLSREKWHPALTDEEGSIVVFCDESCHEAWLEARGER